MSDERLAKHHLSGTKHTSPSSIACLRAAVERLIKVGSVGEPRDRLKCLLDLVDDFVDVVHVVFVLLVEMARGTYTRRVKFLIKNVSDRLLLLLIAKKVAVFVDAVQGSRKSFSVEPTFILIRDIVKCVSHVVKYISVVRLNIFLKRFSLFLICPCLHDFWGQTPLLKTLELLDSWLGLAL